jgi:hypothetical protein
MRQIDKDIPMPRQHSYGSRPGYSASIRQLSVGDSVFFEGAKINSINCACHNVLGAGNYRTRTVEGGVRAWRAR